MGIGYVGPPYLSPNTRHAGFPIRKTRGWTRDVHLSSSASLAALPARDQRHETEDADCGGHSNDGIQSRSHLNSPLFDQFRPLNSSYVRFSPAFESSENVMKLATKRHTSHKTYFNFFVFLVLL